MLIRTAAVTRRVGCTARGMALQQVRTYYDPFTEEPEYVSPINGAPRIPSYWNKWFPYEPVPCSPQLAPYKVRLEPGQIYHFCKCGESRTQPWCEDPPYSCQMLGYEPMAFEHPYEQDVKICGCKHSSSMPYCNGTCYQVWADQNIIGATLAVFGGSFVFSVFMSWMMHP